MRLITPLGRALLLFAALAIAALVAGSAGLQIAGAVMLVVAVGSGAAACRNSGQGLARLYDPERQRRSPSDTRAIADAVSRGQADGGVNAAAYAGSHLIPPGA
jgi:hypothetical protein